MDKGYQLSIFATWPGLTASLVRKYYVKNIETAKGNMKADRKNVKSTTKEVKSEMMTSNPTDGTFRENEYYFKTVELTGKIYSDKTIWFLNTSSKGIKYIMIIYDHDSNAIIIRLLKYKSTLEYLENIKEVHTYLNSCGIHSKMHIMDNEYSDIVKDYLLHSKNINLILVPPPYMHRVNVAEKAIDIFKNHFNSGLATLHPRFPIHL